MVSEMELRASIHKGSLKKVYLLFGNDPYLAKQYAGVIAKKCVPDNSDLNLFVLPEDCTVNQIQENLLQYSFTGDRICVLVSDFDFEGCPQAVFKALCGCVEQAPDNNVLVLYYTGTEINVKKSSRFKKLSAQVEAVGGVVCALNHKSETELVKLLCDGASKRNVRLDAETARYMVSVCSGDLNILVHELEKLAAFLGYTGIVDRELVDAICVKTIEASVYDMSKHIINGRGQQALKLLDSLLACGAAPVEIYSQIVSCYVDIYRVKAAVSAGKRAESIADEFGYAPNRAFVLANAARDGRRLSTGQLRQILKELLASDALVKSEGKISGGSAKTALECLITRILRIAGTEDAVC